MIAAAPVRADDGPKLRLAGAQGPNSTLTRIATTAEVAQEVVIQSVVNEAVTATVDVGPFVDPKGVSRPASAMIDGKPGRTVTLQPFGTAVLAIAATLPVEAEYTAEVTLTHGAVRELARFVVVRTTAALPVAVVALEPIVATAKAFGGSTATFELALEETSGAAVTLDTLELVGLTAKVGEAKHQAHALLAIGDTPARDPATRKITIPAHRTIRVPIVLSELDGAGDYAGTIRLGATGARSVDRAFSLALREPRGTAFGFLLAGCVLAFALRAAVTKLRPRLVLERRLGLVARQVDQRRGDPSGDEAERALWWELARSVDAQLEALRWGAAAEPKSAVAVLETKRELADVWVTRHRQLAGIEPAEVVAQVQPTLEAARAAIASSAATAEALAERRRELDALPQVAREAVRNALSTRVEAMRRAVSAVVADPSRGIGPAASAQVVPLLDRAKQLVDTPDPAAALVPYHEARRVWLVLSLDDLAEALAVQAPPYGFDANTWRAAAEPIAAELEAARAAIGSDADAALRRQRSAQGRYYAVLADGLVRAVRDERNRREASGPIDPGVAKDLDAARADALSGRMAAATDKLDEAGVLIARAREELASVKPTPKKLGAPDTDAAGRDVPSVPGDVTGVRPSRVLPSFRPKVRRGAWILAIDLVATVVAVVVASLVGLAVLWDPSPTWGGSRDYAAAVLWGLGLHGVTFSGAVAVAEKLFGKGDTTT